MKNNPFTWWNTPTQRAQRTEPPVAIAPKQRRPFSGPNLKVLPASGSAMKTPQIFLFTGSNTPYESHE